MKGHGTKFGRKKEEAVAALLTHRNIEEAARSIGVAPNTLLKWLKLPEFDAAYRDATQGYVSASRGEAAAGNLGSRHAPCCKTLIDPATPASVKVRAAEAIFNHAEKAIEIEDIDARVAELERSADQSKTGWRK